MALRRERWDSASRELVGTATAAGLRYTIRVWLDTEDLAALERLRAARRLSRSGCFRLLLSAADRAARDGTAAEGRAR